MDIYHVALIVGEFIASGVVIFKVIDLAKLSESILWFTPERTALIRAANLLLSTLAVVLIGFANHALQITDIQSLVAAVSGVAVVWSTAHASYEVSKKDAE